MSDLPEPFTYDRANDLRKELDGKIIALSNKVDEKVPEKLFYWLFGILVVILGWFFISIGNIKDQLTHLEAKIDAIHIKK